MNSASPAALDRDPLLRCVLTLALAALCVVAPLTAMASETETEPEEETAETERATESATEAAAATEGATEAAAAATETATEAVTETATEAVTEAATEAAPAEAAADAALDPSWADSTQRQSADGDESPEELSIEERRAIQERLKLRRKMVEVHQVMAFMAAGSIIATDTFGLINDIALDHGDPKRADLEPSLVVHRVLAGLSITTYLGTGITAWTMPPALRLNTERDPSVKRGFDSGVLHVVLSVIHGVAMGGVVATGVLQANVTPASPEWETLVHTHAALGFTAAGVVLASGITIGAL